MTGVSGTNRGPEIVLIAALDRHGAIGRDDSLPWHLPDDLKRFKALTLGQPILMGRKTAESLGRALPGRENWVLSRSGIAPFAGMRAVDSMASALAQTQNAETLCVIGGGEIYALSLPLASRLLLTHVDTAVLNADAYFPALDLDDWEAVSRSEHPADARHAYAFAFVDYRRRALSHSLTASDR